MKGLILIYLIDVNLNVMFT